MSVYLQAVTDARQRRETAEHAFRAALAAAVPYHSWTEIARAAGLSRSGTRYLALELNERRRPADERWPPEGGDDIDPHPGPI